MSVKISDLPAALQANLTDLYEVSQSDGNGNYVSKKITPNQIFGAAPLNNPDKGKVWLASTANLVGTYSNGTNGVGATLTCAPGLNNFDGQSLSPNFYVLLPKQTDQRQNGIYQLTTLNGTATVYTRATYYDGSSAGLVNYGDMVYVLNGNTNAQQSFMQNNSSTINVSVGVNPISFTNFKYPTAPGKTYRTISGNDTIIASDLEAVIYYAGSTASTLALAADSIFGTLFNFDSNKTYTITVYNTGSGSITVTQGTAGGLIAPNGAVAAGNYQKLTLTRVAGQNAIWVCTVSNSSLIPCPIMSIFAPSYTNPAQITNVESTTNKNNYRGFNFVQTGNSNIDGRILMPQQWDGSPLTFILSWKTTATTGTAVWNIQATFRRNGDPEDVALSTAVTITSTAAGTAQSAIITAISAGVTPTGTITYPGELEIKINRNGGNGSDNLAAPAILTGVQMLMNYNLSS